MLRDSVTKKISTVSPLDAPATHRSLRPATTSIAPWHHIHHSCHASSKYDRAGSLRTLIASNVTSSRWHLRSACMVRPHFDTHFAKRTSSSLLHIPSVLHMPFLTHLDMPYAKLRSSHITQAQLLNTETDNESSAAEPSAGTRVCRRDHVLTSLRVLHQVPACGYYDLSL